MPAHRINQIQVELAVPELDLAQALIERVSLLRERRLAPLLDRVFDELSGPQQIDRIDELVLELGNVSVEEFEHQFIERVEQALRSALLDRMRVRPNAWVEAAFELLEIFAWTGNLPWWGDTSTKTNPVRTNASLLVQQAPRRLVGLLCDLVEYPVALTRVLAQLDDRTLLEMGRSDSTSGLPLAVREAIAAAHVRIEDGAGVRWPEHAIATPATSRLLVSLDAQLLLQLDDPRLEWPGEARAAMLAVRAQLAALARSPQALGESAVLRELSRALATIPAEAVASLLAGLDADAWNELADAASSTDWPSLREAIAAAHTRIEGEAGVRSPQLAQPRPEHEGDESGPRNVSTGPGSEHSIATPAGSRLLSSLDAQLLRLDELGLEWSAETREAMLAVRAQLAALARSPQALGESAALRELSRALATIPLETVASLLAGLDAVAWKELVDVASSADSPSLREAIAAAHVRIEGDAGVRWPQLAQPRPEHEGDESPRNISARPGSEHSIANSASSRLLVSLDAQLLQLDDPGLVSLADAREVMLAARAQLAALARSPQALEEPAALHELSRALATMPVEIVASLLAGLDAVAWNELVDVASSIDSPSLREAIATEQRRRGADMQPRALGLAHAPELGARDHERTAWQDAMAAESGDLSRADSRYSGSGVLLDSSHAATADSRAASPHSRTDPLESMAAPGSPTVVSPPSPATSRRPSPSISPPPHPARHRALETLDELYVEDAGLVLLWPFLTRFFARLELLDKHRQFIDEPARMQAILLLERLVVDDPEPPEYLLPLAKLLCGLAPTDDFVPGLPLTPKQLTEGELLLSAVIDNAAILRAMPVPSFRSAFLQRHGMLTVNDGTWLLRVERQTYDIVLERFPWSWAWVKLPWMPNPMRVEW